MHGCMRKAVILPDNLVSDLMIISQATTVDISTLTHTTESSLQTMWQYSLSATEAFFLLSIEHLPEKLQNNYLCSSIPAVCAT